MSEDPLGYGAGSFNLYAFGWNNPAKWGDPTGLEAEEEGALDSAVARSATAQRRLGAEITCKLIQLASAIVGAEVGVEVRPVNAKSAKNSCAIYLQTDKYVGRSKDIRHRRRTKLEIFPILYCPPDEAGAVEQLILDLLGGPGSTPNIINVISRKNSNLEKWLEEAAEIVRTAFRDVL